MDESFEHVPVVRPRVLKRPDPIDGSWLRKFAGVSSCDVSDQVGVLYTMEGIHPLYTPVGRVAGRALTVKAWPGDGLAVHGAVSMAGDGDVLVVDARGYTGVSGAGYKMLAGPRRRGLAGFVIDGAVRDVDSFRDDEFPVFGRSRTTHSSTKRRPGEINVPVCCGGVIVEAGDLVIADSDGVAVVPLRHVRDVWEAIERAHPDRVPTEDEIRQADEKRRLNFERVFDAAGGIRGGSPDLSQL